MSEGRCNLNTLWAELVVEELVRCGVDYFCIAPGSRSTPLVAAVAHNVQARHCVVYDERGAGFWAVGYARATGRAAAVITTSGTAAANVFAAVCEASVDRIPMIVLTADRPSELIDAGANQTMRQDGMFGGYVRWAFDMPAPSFDVPWRMLLTTVDQAVYRSAAEGGPVHLNCRYREPLEPCRGGVDEYAAGAAAWMESGRAYTVYAGSRWAAGAEAVEEVRRVLDGTGRGLLVAGRLDSDEERGAVLGLAERLGWPVYADVMSGLRLGRCGTHVIRYLDERLLGEDFKRRVRAQTVLHVGGRTVSKRIGEFFAGNRPDDYVVIKASGERYDAIHGVTLHVQADVAGVCEELDVSGAGRDEEYGELLAACAEKAEGIIARHIGEYAGASEPFVARCVTEEAPEGGGLFVSSSMPIRDVDLYGVSGRGDVHVAANRGISGIDGVISSAAGFAAGSGRATTLLIGDVAFIHDVNALSGIGRAGLRLVIVVINNGGGGIFHFLPIAAHGDIFEEFFAAGHEFSFGGVCETFGVGYERCDGKEEFMRAYRQAVRGSGVHVIEVRTDRGENLGLRRAMKMEIIEMLNASAGAGA